MTNFGTRTILALPKMPERQLRFLLALETFTCDADGWRKIGTGLLASTAGLSVNTTARARRELAKSGAIEYERGDGRGHLSTYRIKVPHNVAHLPEPEKVPSDTDHLSSPGKVPNIVDHLSETGKVPKQAPERYPNRPRKGGSRNPAISGNAIGALEPIALESSALSRAAPDSRVILAGLDGLDLDDDEISFIITELGPRHPDLSGYLLDQIGKDNAVRLTAWIRRKLGLREPWCGDLECDRQTRLRVTETDDGPKASRCPKCHPNRARLR